jgi:hypothetical protein
MQPPFWFSLRPCFAGNVFFFAALEQSSIAMARLSVGDHFFCPGVTVNGGAIVEAERSG